MHERTIEKTMHIYIHKIYIADFHSTQLMVARSPMHLLLFSEYIVGFHANFLGHCYIMLSEMNKTSSEGAGYNILHPGFQEGAASAIIMWSIHG